MTHALVRAENRLVPGPEERRANTMRSLSLEGELLRVVDHFAKAGIEVAVLKGVHQQRTIYGHVGSRMLADNDLLVRRRDVLRTGKLLEAIGYRPSVKWSLEEALRSIDEFGYVRQAQGRGLVVDLHWGVLPAKLLPVTEADIWSQMRRTDLRGRAIWTPHFALGILIAAWQAVAHVSTDPARFGELATWWNQASPDKRASAHELAKRLGCPEILAFPLRTAWQLGVLDEEPAASVTSRIHARLFAARVARNRPVRGLLVVSGRLFPAGPRRSLAYVWSRFRVSDAELSQTPGAASPWSHTLGPRIGRIVNAVFPRG